MKVMNLTQVENADAEFYTRPQTLSETRDRMRLLLLDLEDLSKRLARKEVAIRAAKTLWSVLSPESVARLENEANRMAMLVQETDSKIVETARLIVQQADKAEAVTT